MKIIKGLSFALLLVSLFSSCVKPTVSTVKSEEECWPFTDVDKPEPFELTFCEGGGWFRTVDGCDIYSGNWHVPGEGVFIHAYTNARNYYGSDFFVVMTNSEGEVLAGPHGVGGADVMFGSRGFCADLNQDGVIDYLVEVSCGGYGLDYGNALITVFLSVGKGFMVIPLHDLWVNKDSLVDLDHDGCPEFIYAVVCYGDENGNGQRNPYQVMNILEFGPTGLVSANHKRSGFPVWKWSPDDENDKPTILLTKEQRVRLWRNQAPGFIPEELADEQ